MEREAIRRAWVLLIGMSVLAVDVYVILPLSLQALEFFRGEEFRHFARFHILLVSGLLISVAGVGFRFMRLRWLLMVIVGFCAATWIVEWSAYIVDFYYPDQYLLDGETLSWQAVTYPAQWLLLSIANWHMFFGPPSAIYFGRHAVPSPPGTISQGETSPSSTAE